MRFRTTNEAKKRKFFSKVYRVENPFCGVPWSDGYHFWPWKMVTTTGKKRYLQKEHKNKGKKTTMKIGDNLHKNSNLRKNGGKCERSMYDYIFTRNKNNDEARWRLQRPRKHKLEPATNTTAKISVHIAASVERENVPRDFWVSIGAWCCTEHIFRIPSRPLLLSPTTPAAMKTRFWFTCTRDRHDRHDRHERTACNRGLCTRKTVSLANEGGTKEKCTGEKGVARRCETLGYQTWFFWKIQFLFSSKREKFWRKLNQNYITRTGAIRDKIL